MSESAGFSTTDAVFGTNPVTAPFYWGGKGAMSLLDKSNPKPKAELPDPNADEEQKKKAAEVAAENARKTAPRGVSANILNDGGAAGLLDEPTSAKKVLLGY